MKRLKPHTMTDTSYYSDILKDMSNKDESVRNAYDRYRCGTKIFTRELMKQYRNKN